MTMETIESSQQQWHGIISGFTDTNLIQLWEYGSTKRELQGWQMVHHIFCVDGKLVGAAQAMVKYIPLVRRGVVWINRAPLWQVNERVNDLSLLSPMLEALSHYWVQERGMYLRVAPTMFDTEEARALVERAGFHVLDDTQWFSARVDLQKPIEILRADLEKKWRNCLKKAEALGVVYTIGNAPHDMTRLVEDYEVFLKQKDFSTAVTPGFVAYLHGLLPHDRKMWVLTAMCDRHHLGSILLASYNSTVEYLVGALSEDGKRVNAGQYLLWNGIREMKQRGYHVFDLGGMDPKKTPPGIFHFKAGLAGVPYQLLGACEAYRGIIARGIRFLVQSRL